MKRYFLVIAISVFQITILFAQIPTDGLIANYPFNGNANDETGNGNNGTVYGATLSEDRFGNVDRAYVFDGVNDYIGGIANSSLIVTDQLTISAWINTDFIGSESIFTYGYSSSLGLQYSLLKANVDDSNRIYFLAEGNNTFEPVGPAYGSSSLLLDEWQHLLVRYDGSVLELYVDGKLDSTFTINDSFKQSAYDYFYIGQRQGGGGPNGIDMNFTGSIDDIRIYNRAVSSEEILDLYTESQCFETIYDTITTEVFDTTYVTITTEVFDTTYVTINDTITTEVFDTIWTEVFDTTYVTINDTITTEVFDTTYITVTDYVSVTDTLIIDAVLTGINPPDNINTLKIYPNPAKEYIFINTGDYTKMNGYQLKIINELGAMVYETNVEDQLYEVNLSTWTGMGLYIVQVIDSGGNVIDIKKIILQ